MRIILAGALVALTISASLAEDVYVDGYQHRDGTYVQPYHRSAPDSSRSNNYSYDGNTNPYTGKTGTDSGSNKFGFSYNGNETLGNPGR